MELRLEMTLISHLEMDDQILVFKRLDGTAQEDQIPQLTLVLRYEEMELDLIIILLIETTTIQFLVMDAQVFEK